MHFHKFRNLIKTNLTKFSSFLIVDKTLKVKQQNSYFRVSFSVSLTPNDENLHPNSATVSIKHTVLDLSC